MTTYIFDRQYLGRSEHSFSGSDIEPGCVSCHTDNPKHAGDVSSMIHFLSRTENESRYFVVKQPYIETVESSNQLME
jgi:hypothetical protein